MTPHTRTWLESLEILGDEACKKIKDGEDKGIAINMTAHEAVERTTKYAQICDDLHFKPTVRGKSGVEYAAEVELFVFARGVIAEMVING